MRTELLCISVLRAASGPRVKLAICKSALTPIVLVLFLLFVLFLSICVVMLASWSPSSIAAHFAFCFTSCVVKRWSRVSLTLCCFVVYSTRQFVLCLTLCCFVLVLFSPLSIEYLD